MIQNWKPSALIIISWFFYSMLITWIHGQIYLQTHFINEWLFANIGKENYSFIVFGLSLYDFLVYVILTIPFAVFAAKLLSGKSLWYTLASAITIVFLWDYRLVIGSSSEFASFVSLLGVGTYLTIFYIYFSLPIITFVIKRMHRAKPI